MGGARDAGQSPKKTFAHQNNRQENDGLHSFLHEMDLHDVALPNLLLTPQRSTPVSFRKDPQTFQVWCTGFRAVSFISLQSEPHKDLGARKRSGVEAVIAFWSDPCRSKVRVSQWLS